MLETFSSGPAPSSSSKSKMPFVRRRRPHLTSTRTDQIEVQGTTYLCFPLDHSWFQGNINTDDESSYSLYGERVLSDQQQQSCTNNNENGVESPSLIKSEENNNLSKGDYDNNEGPKDSSTTGDLNNKSNNLQQGHYKVVLTDHFTGLSYHLPRIGVNLMKNGTTGDEETNLFSCTESDADVKFQVQNIYKGQKADMVIQKCLGSSSSLLGQKSLVYSGPISIVFNEVIENGRSWSL